MHVQRHAVRRTGGEIAVGIEPASGDAHTVAASRLDEPYATPRDLDDAVALAPADAVLAVHRKVQQDLFAAGRNQFGRDTRGGRTPLVHSQSGDRGGGDRDHQEISGTQQRHRQSGRRSRRAAARRARPSQR